MSSVEQLGYLAFEVADLGAWEAFATKVLGLEVATRWDTGMSLRMDGHAQRFFLHEGPADDLAAIGWEIASGDALDALVARLEEAGFDTRQADDATTKARQVERLVHVRDPGGIELELHTGPALASETFSSALVPNGFIADGYGLGHLVITAPNEAATRSFYTELLGFKLSDRIVCEIYGYPVDITFLHVNPRHHSLAFGGPQPKKMHHFLLEVPTLDEVGMAFDRALKNRVKIAQTIGRHPNDKMISFYAHTPSGFQFEYGCGGFLIDDDAWDPVVHDRVSDWGHHPPAIVGRAGGKK